MIRIQQAASLRVLGYFITLNFLLPPSFAWAQSRLEAVIKAAQQEGALTVNAPASLSAPERVEFVRTFLKKYGLKIADIAQEIARGSTADLGRFGIGFAPDAWRVFAESDTA
jgi:hypothetical protein